MDYLFKAEKIVRREDQNPRQLRVLPAILRESFRGAGRKTSRERRRKGMEPVRSRSLSYYIVNHEGLGLRPGVHGKPGQVRLPPGPAGGDPPLLPPPQPRACGHPG